MYSGLANFVMAEIQIVAITEFLLDSELLSKILPDIFIGFGFIIPLVLAAGWIRIRSSDDGESRTARAIDSVAAMAIFSWIGFFVGQRMVYHFDKPDRFVLGSLLACAFATLVLALPASAFLRGESTNTTERNGFWKRFWCSIRFGLNLIRPVIPVVSRLVVVFALAAGISAYAFLISHVHVTVTLKQEEGEETPDFLYCYISSDGEPVDSGGANMSSGGKLLNFTKTDKRDENAISLWIPVVNHSADDWTGSSLVVGYNTKAAKQGNANAEGRFGGRLSTIQLKELTPVQDSLLNLPSYVVSILPRSPS